VLRALRAAPGSSLDGLADALGFARTNFGRSLSHGLQEQVSRLVAAGLVEEEAGDYRLSERGRRLLAERALGGARLSGPNDTPGGEAGEFDFERVIQEALDALPGELRAAMSNVTIVVEDEPPPGSRLLGLYQGVPLTRRGTGYSSGALPDKITIYRRPLERLCGGDHEHLRQQIGHVVVHEVAHHFGISDQRLIELGRY
jgi:predicted Zn-dependent protease with MMP-like domain